MPGRWTSVLPEAHMLTLCAPAVLFKRMHNLRRIPASLIQVRHAVPLIDLFNEAFHRKPFSRLGPPRLYPRPWAILPSMMAGEQSVLQPVCARPLAAPM
jgi:hypothetical protein